VILEHGATGCVVGSMQRDSDPHLVASFSVASYGRRKSLYEPESASPVRRLKWSPTSTTFKVNPDIWLKGGTQ
jgi:hypothetical protein